MPIFHFDIADGVRLEDPVGLDCAMKAMPGKPPI